ncbi:MAG TPA: flavin reductase family protein [Burkholderiales bacterium]|nr:flavin reductase family protein [Burkholderiales bacterium]
MDLEFASLPLQERYKLLASLVIPRPIAWISTVNAAGVNNCAPYSFFNAFAEDPPLCMISFGPRQDGLAKHTLKNIQDTGEFVVNLVDEATANAMHISAEEIPEEESEFEKTGLTPVPALRVRHPRIAEAPVSFECRVYKMLEITATRIFIFGEIILLHAREGIVDPLTKRVDEAHYQPIGRLYANRYCTTRQRFVLPGELPE